MGGYNLTASNYRLNSKQNHSLKFSLKLKFESILRRVIHSNEEDELSSVDQFKFPFEMQDMGHPTSKDGPF